MSIDLDPLALAIVGVYAIQITISVWGSLWSFSVFKRVLRRTTGLSSWRPLQCLRMAMSSDVAGFALGFGVFLSFFALRGVLWSPVWILRAMKVNPLPSSPWVLTTGAISALGMCAAILFLIHKMSGDIRKALREPRFSVWAVGVTAAGTYIAYQVYIVVRE